MELKVSLRHHEVVHPSGVGVTKGWDRNIRGVVTRVMEDRVLVQWPGVEDELLMECLVGTGEFSEPPRAYTLYVMHSNEEE